jgi:5-amino-6-(5-phosphoribosylamino)uracil reductase/2,5-diamino-6-(ribosylamino)-4(3H)-pyrimidinone 5'-phosphate reductase
MIITTVSELTIDGKLSLGAGRSSKDLFAFYGSELGRWFHAQRAAHDAIMVGAGTVRSDNPELTVRNAPGKNPLRVIALGLTALPAESHILNDGIRTVLAKPTGHLQTYAAPHIETIQCGNTAVDLPNLIQHLSGQGIRSLMVEGGSRLLHSFFRDNLVDRIVIKHIPVLFGDPLAPNFLEGAQIALSEWQVEAWQCIGGVGVSAYVRKDATVRSVAA